MSRLKMLFSAKPKTEIETVIEGENSNLKNGFTLIELMVVVVIIGILAALAIPKFLGATDKAKLSEAKINCKAISTQMLVEKIEIGTFPTVITGLNWYTENGNSASTKYFTFSLNDDGDSVLATPINDFGDYVAGTDYISYSLMGLGDINGVK